MKRAIALLIAIATTLCGAVTVEYDLTMVLKVPRVYNNMTSEGYRKYQTQRVNGILRVIVNDCQSEPTIEVVGLCNRTHKVNSKCVTYDTVVDGSSFWHSIGSNATGSFRKSSVCIRIDADPSYNIGDDEPDNTLILALSGSGTEKAISGKVAGQIGCGCRAYGHKSPTRIMWTDQVVDIASVYGFWKAKYKRTVR